MRADAPIVRPSPPWTLSHSSSNLAKSTKNEDREGEMKIALPRGSRKLCESMRWMGADGWYGPQSTRLWKCGSSGAGEGKMEAIGESAESRG